MIRIPVTNLPTLVERLNSGTNKREVKRIFNMMAKVVVALGFAKRTMDITDLSVGMDSQGQRWLYVHERDSAVVTSVSGQPS
jgi:hypothetical protein